MRVAVLPSAVLLFLLAPGSDLFGSPGAGVAVAQAAPGDAVPAAPEPIHRDERSDGPVIPGGQEAVFGPMLGMSATLPGQCRMAGANIDHNIVTATYNCAAGEVVVTLRHISTAPQGATKTEHFGIAVESGSPPEGFIDALVQLVRANEAKVRWTWPEEAAGPTRRFPSLRVFVAAIGVVGAALGVLARWRRHR